MAKRLSLLFKWAGAILLLLSLLGVFAHPDRAALYRALERHHAVPATAATQGLMSYFAVAPETIAATESLEFIGQFVGDPPNLLGSSGMVVAHVRGQERSVVVAEWHDVRAWAQAPSTLYPWLSFALITTGALIDTLVAVRSRPRRVQLV
jgi:hypothetical protein